MLVNEQRTLRVTPEAWGKLALYVFLAETEIGGLASVEMDGDDFVLTDTFLIEQEATDVNNELAPEALSQFLIDYQARGGDPSQLRLWWHSHAREAVFWSMEDHQTIEHFGGEMLLSLVGNHAGKFIARLDRFSPRRETVGWVDVVRPASLPRLDSPEADRIREEIAALVHISQRSTNKLWTDDVAPANHLERRI